MNFTDSIFSKLDEGHWVIEDLFRLYRNKLSESLSDSEILRLCAQLSLTHYRKLKSEDVLINFQNKGLDDFNISTKVESLIVQTYMSRNEKIEIAQFSSGESNKIKEALSFIQIKSESLRLIVDKNLELFVRVKGASFKGSSHPHFQGIMFIGDGINSLSVEQVAVSIVHELAHQELFLINLIDRLVQQKFDFNEIHAPLQGKSRPPIGRLHSLWALYRMVQFQNLIGLNSERHHGLLIENIRAFSDGELTEKGYSLVDIARENAA